MKRRHSEMINEMAALQANKSSSQLCDRRFSKAIGKLQKQEKKFYHIYNHKKRPGATFTDLERKMLAQVEDCDSGAQLRALLTAELYERFCRGQCDTFLAKQTDQCDHNLLVDHLQVLAFKSLFPKTNFLAAEVEFHLWDVPGVTCGAKFVDKSLAHYFAATYLVKMLRLADRPKDFDKFFMKLIDGNWMSRIGYRCPWGRMLDFVSQLLLRCPGNLALELTESQLNAAVIEGALRTAAKEGRSGIIKFIVHSLKKTMDQPQMRAKQSNFHLSEQKMGRLMQLAAANEHIATVEMLFDMALSDQLDMKDAVWKLFEKFHLRLHLLRAYGHERFVERLMEYLVKCGIDAEDLLYPDPMSSALVEGAAVERNSKLLERIFHFAKRHDIPVNIALRTFVLGSPLHSAAVGGCAQVIDKIVHYAVDNDYKVAKMMEKKLGGQTPVHLAAFYGNAEAVAALLKAAAHNGIDRSSLMGLDDFGKSPFDLIGSDVENVIKALIARY